MILNAHHIKNNSVLGSGCSFISCHGYCTDRSVRTYIRAETALDTVVAVPYGNVDSDTALLICGSAGRCTAVCVGADYGYGNGVAFLGVDLDLDVVNEINNVLSVAGSYHNIILFAFSSAPALGNIYLDNVLGTCVDGCPVLLNDVLTLTAIGLLSGCLHQTDRVFLGDDVGQLEESGLQDGVDTCGAHACLNTDLDTVDGVELDIVVMDESLDLRRDTSLKLVLAP